MRDISMCPWPHEINSPICVYDRGSYEKYKTGEYELPKRCICGAELTYVEPVLIALVVQDQMTGEVIAQTKMPVRFLTIDLLNDASSSDLPPEDLERKWVVSEQQRERTLKRQYLADQRSKKTDPLIDCLDCESCYSASAGPVAQNYFCAAMGGKHLFWACGHSLDFLNAPAECPKRSK